MTDDPYGQANILKRNYDAAGWCEVTLGDFMESNRQLQEAARQMYDKEHPATDADLPALAALVAKLGPAFAAWLRRQEGDT